VEVLRDLEACPRPSSGTAVTIGAYDGVHRGHRVVIDRVRAMAAEERLETALVTFDRHPAMVVRPESAPLVLTDLDQKLELLAETGLGRTLVLTFDEHRSHESAEDFVEEVLVGCLGARVVVVGEDFHFGHERRGNVQLLERMGADHGFEVRGIELVGLDAEPAAEDAQVSSTAIRRALADGRLEDANEMLGRPHEVRGVVVEGDKRGRDLGFPTANVSVSSEIQLPADGIYAGWHVRPDGSRQPAAVSLGRRPTFYETAHASLLETHLLDFDGDLYDERARVQFIERLRPEERFEDVDELTAQMRRDCDRAREVLLG